MGAHQPTSRRSSTNTEGLGTAGFQLINGSCGSSTCLLAILDCPVTAQALILRYIKSGFNVKEDGMTVDYKAVSGKEWYKAADEKTTSSKDTNDTICVILRGLPNQ